MTREIKFRAWNKENKIMHQPCSMVSNWDSKTMSYQTETPVCNYMQFTGLHDKNGKEIYEGDIIQRYQDEIFEVRWEELQSGFGVYIGVLKPRSHWRELYKFLDFEIIGNIYENPELLSVKSNV